MLTEDPPMFDDEEDYSLLFNTLADSLSLAANLFPQILQLSTMEDYKEPVNSLLKSMVDSGYLTAKDYEAYFSKLYFDAKIELKKQQNQDEKLLQKQNNESIKDDDESSTDDADDNDYANMRKYSASPLLSDYSALLAPFYTTKESVHTFLQSKYNPKIPGCKWMQPLRW